MISEATKGRLYVLAAAVLWSTNGLFVKSELFADWPDERRGMLFAFWRALFAVLTIAPLVRGVQWNVRQLPMALAFASMSVAFLQSMVWTTAANAIWLQNIAPVWLCIYARLSGETIDRRDLTTLGFAMLGIGLILGCELGGADWSGVAAWGVVLGVVSGLFYAVIILFLRRLRGVDSAWLVVVNLSATALLLAWLPPAVGIWPHGVQWPVLIAFGVVQLGMPYFLFARGLQRISSHEGAAIALLEPIFTPIWVALRYGELPAWWTIAGGSLIFAGLMWRYVPRRGR